MGQLQTEIDPQGLEGFYLYREDISGLALAGFYCACVSSYITFKLLHMQCPMIFFDCQLGEREPAMLIYCNAIIMKQGLRNVFCISAVISHRDSALFQKAGATGLRTGPLSRTDVLWSLLPSISCLTYCFYSGV